MTDSIERSLKDIGERGVDFVKSRTRYKIVRDSVYYEIKKTSNTGYSIQFDVPYFFAIYLERGRSAIRATESRALVFFVNPRDDPRINPSYPTKRPRRLTRSQYEKGIRINRFMKKNNPDGGEQQYMRVVPWFHSKEQYVAGYEGEFVFEDLAKFISEEIKRSVSLNAKEETVKEVKETLKTIQRTKFKFRI